VDDVAAICEVLRRSIVELCAADHGHDPKFLDGWLANKTPENVAAWIADPGNVFYVADAGGRIAGAAAMNRSGTITLNYVSPDARFKGVSKSLLAALEREAAAMGLTRCTLESTKTARRFYQMAGYRETEGAACGVCRPMVKDLAESPKAR
jgi:GNAT superfamily N-acetyltransferase